MLKKSVVKSRQVVKVTFELRLEEVADGSDIETIRVMGDYNDWDAAAVPLKFN